MTMDTVRKPEAERDQGFTLIELLVVIVIVGILAAIAIPTFLSQRQKAVDAGIESDLKALATIEETVYTDGAGYSATKATLDAAGFKPSSGNVIQIAVTANGYCLKGTNTGGSQTFWHDSSAGGLSSGTTAPTGGICAGATLATVYP
ncbi:prepilin-type N-terminal cleavage/methylation domain-containing protein [Nocardioides sp. YIM 152588]|uniref:type IV pilin protein n=1 Tax=Nocardioides sp. YIM 152588 TaxID=3158259 RepID=UPI0032E45799